MIAKSQIGYRPDYYCVQTNPSFLPPLRRWPSINSENTVIRCDIKTKENSTISTACLGGSHGKLWQLIILVASIIFILRHCRRAGLSLPYIVYYDAITHSPGRSWGVRKNKIPIQAWSGTTKSWNSLISRVERSFVIRRLLLSKVPRSPWQDVMVVLIRFLTLRRLTMRRFSSRLLHSLSNVST